MLNSRQLNAIMINAISIKMIVTFPHNAIELCGNAAWISAIYCTIIAAAIFFATRAVYSSNRDVISIAQIVGGSGLRIATGVLIFIILGANFFSLVRTFPEIIRLVLLQQTYVEMIGVIFVLCIVLGALCGIESIGRVHEIFVPIAGIVFILFLLLLISSMDFYNILPILGKGSFSLFVDNISFLSLFSDLLVLNMLLPHTQSLSICKKSGTKAIVVSGACAAAILLVYGLSYAFPMTAQYIIPVYQLERLIHLSSFFSRFEAVFQFIWSILILLYGSLYLAVLGEVWQKSFALKHSRPLIMVIAVVIIGAAVLPKSLSVMIQWESFINRWIYIPAFAIPLLFGIVGKIKKIG